MLSGELCESEALKAKSGLKRSSELAENALKVNISKNEADKNANNLFFILILNRVSCMNGRIIHFYVESE